MAGKVSQPENAKSGYRMVFVTKTVVVIGVIGLIVLFLGYVGRETFAAPVHFFAYQVNACNDTARCTITFQQYIPSDLETKWFENVESWQSDYCKAWDQQHEDLLALVNAVNAVRENESHGDVASLSKLLSRFKYKVTCNGDTKTRYRWIEPLVGALRHPLALCGRDPVQHLLDRSYIITETSEDLPTGTYRKHWYFDLGASLYSDGDGGASQQYFVEEYTKRRLGFDGMYLWEPTPGANVFQKGFNPSLAHMYHYYNTYAEVNTSSEFNPFTIMKKIAKPADFVMFKLDIDTSEPENQFVLQLMNDVQLVSLVDEFYFEHHVMFEPMAQYWRDSSDKAATLKTSYDLFLQLRKAGIRAHGWP